jgi:predicted AlkP superfamily pyrophosphatase or phosphodiesterase
MEEGAWFPDCHIAYGGTSTAPGHASLLTGCPPARHGIIENDWYDRSRGEKVYCVGTERHQFVPPAPGGKIDPKKLPGSPERLLAPTLGDALKEATGGQAKVVSLSLKDRSAVLPAGKTPDACYWFDSTTGAAVTSTYYRERLHPWVEEFNNSKPADRWFGRSWERLRPDLDYALHSSPDDSPGEGRGVAQGRTFPHPMTGGLKGPGKYYYGAAANSPFGNDLLLELVKKAIDAEGLGTRDVPDLLSVSFSSNDLIGHCWGPDSQEVLDVTLRSDRTVRELLEHLDARVGKGRYMVILTADHGVCPLPEAARKQGKDARRINPDFLETQLPAFLQQKFGKEGVEQNWVECVNDFSTWLNQRTIQQNGLTSAAVEEAVASWMRQQPGVQTAYTRSELLKGVPEDDVLGQRVRRSFHPERSGDVVVVLKPWHLLTAATEGTNHGSPHSHDTHVPFLVLGRGLNRGVHAEEIAPQAAAAIFARALGIKPPAMAGTPVPAGLFR